MKLYTALLAATLLVPGVALAQNGSSQGSNSTGTSNSTSSQQSSSMNNSQNSMSNQSQSSSGQQQLEGCVTRKETDFYITPVNGMPVRLRGNQDLSSAENHNARVSGNYDNSSNASQTSSSQSQNSSSTGASSSSSTTGSNGQQSSSNGKDFLVTRVDAITTSCPANGQNGSNQNQSSQH